MATFGMQLLSHIMRNGNLNEALDWGITKEDLLAAEEKAILDMMVAYHGQHNAVWGPQFLAQKFPTFELCDDGHQMSVGALCTEVRTARLRMEAKEAAVKLAAEAEVDPIAALSSHQAKISELIHLSSSRKTDIHFGDAMPEIYNDYEKMERGEYSPKLLWPWTIMNNMTFGLQDDDYVIIYGRPKSKKSFVLSYMIASAWESSKPVLLYTKEMTPKNIMKRIAAFVAQLPYQEFRTGHLSFREKEELLAVREQAIQLKLKQTFVCLSGRDAPSGGDTISWLRAKVEKYRPACVFIDGLYLMSPEGGKKNMATHDKVENISRATRQMILDTKTPVVATLQANRQAAKNEKAELDEIAFSDSIGQDATVAMRVIADKHSPTISVIMAGSREFSLHGFRIGGVPCTDFTFKEILTEKDINKAKTEDSKLDEPDGKNEHASKNGKTMNGKGDVDKIIAQQLRALRV